MHVLRFEEIIDEFKENNSDIVLVLNSGKELGFSGDLLKDSKIDLYGLFYCGTWVVEISSIIAIGDRTEAFEELKALIKEWGFDD